MTFPADIHIEAARVLVRTFQPGDEARLRPLIEAGDFTALPPGAPGTASELPDYLAGGVHRLRESGAGVHLAIVAGGEHVGAISLFKTDWDLQATEVGYGVAVPHRGKGYATEALTALTGWTLTKGGMQRVQLTANTDNLPSLRVATKAGFVAEGVLRRASLEDDGLHDLAVFSRLNDDQQA